LTGSEAEQPRTAPANRHSTYLYRLQNLTARGRTLCAELVQSMEKLRGVSPNSSGFDQNPFARTRIFAAKPLHRLWP